MLILSSFFILVINGCGKNETNNTLRPFTPPLPISTNTIRITPSSICNIEQDLNRSCAEFAEKKLHYEFDPNNPTTWDNAFPSRENWARRLKTFKAALKQNWNTYSSRRYGFKFDYPSDWNVFVSTSGNQIVVSRPGEQIDLPLVIEVKDYRTAPEGSKDSATYDIGNTYVTKVGLAKEKIDIQEFVRIPDANRKYVVLDTYYSTFDYHNFYHRGTFFINNDLITVTQPLSVIIPDIAGGHGTEINDLLEKIKNNSINELVTREIDFTDRLIASFRSK